jgi:hypothetical protein
LLRADEIYAFQKVLEERVKSTSFRRIHRNAMVNVDHVRGHLLTTCWRAKYGPGNPRWPCPLMPKNSPLTWKTIRLARISLAQLRLLRTIEG